MGITELFHSLSFKNDFVPHDKIRIVTMRQDNALISHLIRFFPAKRYICTAQFNHKSILINDLIMAFAEFAMNFHAKPNELKNFFFVKQFAH